MSRGCGARTPLRPPPLAPTGLAAAPGTLGETELLAQRVRRAGNRPLCVPEKRKAAEDAAAQDNTRRCRFSSPIIRAAICRALPRERCTGGKRVHSLPGLMAA